MNAKLLFCGLMAVSLAAASQDRSHQQSVTVKNLTGQTVDLWLNGEYRQLKEKSAINYPCLPGEKVEIQHEVKLDHLECGGQREIIR